MVRVRNVGPPLTGNRSPGTEPGCEGSASQRTADT